MGKTFKKVFWITLGTAAAWAVAIKPRTKGKPDMSVFSAYDYANGGLHDFCKGLPDNTIPAYEKALKHGYGVIMDVRVTKDDVPVVYTDHELWRLCSKDGSVEDSTYEELKEHKLAGTDIGIATLKEALDFVDGQVPVLLNLRAHEDNCVKLCEAAAIPLDQYDGVIAIESLDFRCVRWFMRYRPAIIRGQMFEKSLDFGNTFFTFLKRAAGNLLLTNCMTKPDFISTHMIDTKSISLKACHLLYQVPIMNWTISTMKDYAKARNMDAMVAFEDIEP